MPIRRRVHIIVAIEGMDGSGKTTQAKMLVKRLNDYGYSSKYVRPVYLLLEFLPSSISKYISISPRYERVKYNAESDFIIFKRVLLCILGYIYALVTLSTMKILYKNKIVICDRYFYQFFYDLFSERGWTIIEKFPRPHVLIILEGNLDHIYARMIDDNDKSINRSYYEGYKSLCKRLDKYPNCHYISSDKDKNLIHNIIYDITETKLKEANNG